MDENSQDTVTSQMSDLTDLPSTQEIIENASFEEDEQLERVARAVEVLESMDSHTRGRNLLVYLNHPMLELTGKVIVAQMIQSAAEQVDWQDRVNQVERFFWNTVLSRLAERGCLTSSNATPQVDPFSDLDDIHSMGYEAQNQGYNFAGRLAVRDGLKDQFRGRFSLNWLTNALERHGEEYVLELTGQAITLAAVENDDANAYETEGAHVIPHFLGDLKPSFERERLQLWQSLYMMFPSLWQRFTPEDIEHISNGMTLLAFDHKAFGKMQIGLKHLYGETFEVIHHKKAGTKIYFEGWPQWEELGGKRIPVVTFKYPSTTRDEDMVSHRLLKIHYIIGSLFHASGGTERLEDELENDEDAPPLPSTAPAGRVEQERWTSALYKRLNRISMMLTLPRRR
ncbi:hypothetical protein BJ508DRAFT_415708 [Ascobolus immersus RN42]|uniref:HNH nuclease domain-containing protein n=1 Tax=Ascobolus immersus RN42 TaxID=1160509 RepID=A0A3N4I3D3_ASCIM|nr:hypothetical protein BJ508DRAFT_415708 [Ascobolus immersus RN42]